MHFVKEINVTVGDHLYWQSIKEVVCYSLNYSSHYLLLIVHEMWTTVVTFTISTFPYGFIQSNRTILRRVKKKNVKFLLYSPLERPQKGHSFLCSVVFFSLLSFHRRNNKNVPKKHSGRPYRNCNGLLFFRHRSQPGDMNRSLEGILSFKTIKYGFHSTVFTISDTKTK